MKAIYILIVLFFCATLFAEENVSKQKIPMPPWTETTGAPTSSIQVLGYLFQVLPLMSESTMEDINEALDRDASSGELLAIIYSENLNRRLIDYENPDNNVSSFNALAELLRILKLYESQWEDHYSNLENLWSLGAGSSNSIGYLIQQIMDFEELAERIQDPNDILEDIDKYENLFNLPGAAYPMLIWSCHFLNKETYQRARPLLKYLTSNQNNNLFVRGGAKFWYGYLLYQYYKEFDEALKYLYVVHTYPACLVNIDWSYILTAKIFIRKNMPETALALLSIRIPTMDHQIEEINKARICFDLLYKKNKIPEAALQISRTLNAEQGSSNKKKGSLVKFAKKKIKIKHPKIDYESLVQNAMLSNSYENYEIEVIRQALTGPEQAKNNPLVTDMLLHNWPLIEDINASILTNRMLCNNVFGQERRTDIEY